MGAEVPTGVRVPCRGVGGVVGSLEEDEDCCTREEEWMGCFGEMQGELACSGQMGRGVRCI